MKVNFRMYDQGDDILLAACDEDLLGVTLEEGDIHLNVKESFYGGDIIDIESDEKRLQTKFKKATIGNLVGEEVVKAAVEAGFGDEDDIMRIEDVPHLQVVRI